MIKHQIFGVSNNIRDILFLQIQSGSFIRITIATFSGSHASNNPMLNFIVYVPSRDQHPLHIVLKNGKRLIDILH